MAYPPLVSVTDFEEQVGRALTPDEALAAERYLRNASTLVRSVAAQTWVDANGNLTAVPDAAYTVTLEAALRRFENPKGVISENIGPLAYRLAAGDNNAGVFLTSQEMQLIAGLRVRGGLVSVKMRTESYVPADVTELPLA